MSFKQRASVITRFVKTVGNSALGVWIGIGTPETAAISGETNTIIMWDELNAGCYGGLLSNSQQVQLVYFNGPGDSLHEVAFWDSQGLACVSPSYMRVAGESYPQLPFGANWQDFDLPSGGWGQSGYYRDVAGVVHCSGLIKRKVAGLPATTEVMFTLPVGYRPLKNKGFACPTSGGASCFIQVSPDGTVTLQNNTTANIHPDLYLCVDPISFSTIH